MLQTQLGCGDGDQPVLAASNLRRDVQFGLVSFQAIGRLCKVEQAVDLRLEFDLGLDHAVIAHGLVAAGIGLELGAVHGHRT